MKLTPVLLPYFFMLCFFLPEVSAQSYLRNSIQLSANADFPIAHEFVRDYPFVPFGNDISTKRTFAFGGTITYRKHFKNRLSLDIGLTGGTDSDFYTINIRTDFLEEGILEKTFTRDYFDYDYLFGGLTLNIGYDLFQFKKSLFSLKTGVSAISFLPISIDKKLWINSNNQKVQIFQNNLQVNEQDAVYLLSVFEADYRHMLGKNFFLGIAANVKFSLDGREYVKGNYRIIGESQELTGTYSKWWLSSGLNIYGGYYFGE